MNNDNSMDKVEGQVHQNDLSKDALNNRFINKNHVKYDSSDEEQEGHQENNQSDNLADESMERHLQNLQNKDLENDQKNGRGNGRGNRGNRGNRGGSVEEQKQEEQKPEESSPRRGGRGGRGNRKDDEQTQEVKQVEQEQGRCRGRDRRNVQKQVQNQEKPQQDELEKVQQKQLPQAQKQEAEPQQKTEKVDDSAWDDDEQQKPKPVEIKGRQTRGQKQPEPEQKKAQKLDESDWGQQVDKQTVKPTPGRRGAQDQKQEDENALQPDKSGAWNSTQQKAEQPSGERSGRGRGNRNQNNDNQDEQQPRRGNRGNREPRQGQEDDNNQRGFNGGGRGFFKGGNREFDHHRGGNRDFGNNGERRPWENRDHQGERGGRGGFGGGRGGGYNRGSSRDGQEGEFGLGRGHRQGNFDRNQGGNFQRNEYNRRDYNRTQQQAPQSNPPSQLLQSSVSSLAVSNTPTSIQPKGQQSWPEISLYIKKCKVSLTFRSLSQHQADVLVFPFEDLKFKLYPSTLINAASKHDYRKRVEEKEESGYWKKSLGWRKPCLGMGSFREVIFLKLQRQTEHYFPKAVHTLFQYAAAKPTKESKETESKVQSLVFPICKELAQFKDILNAVIISLQTLKDHDKCDIKRFEFSTKDPEYFKECLQIFSTRIAEDLDANKIYIL